MNKTISFQQKLVIVGLPLIIIGLMILIAKSSMFLNNPNELSLAITFDLLLTVPFVYFLLIRKTKVPKTTVVPLLIFGMVICTLLLPSENQYYLDLFKTWIFPVVELFVITFVIYNVRKGIKRFKLNNNTTVDFFTALKNTCFEILPKIAVVPVVTEISVFYYGFLSWRKIKLKEHEFSYHKGSGTVALLIAIILIVAIETVALHTLLAKWSNIAAWILTCLSIYSGIQILGFLKSMFYRPISIENNHLYLRYGIMSETIIALKNIDKIEISSKDIDVNNQTRKLSILGSLESHNMVFHLKADNQLIGLYGSKKMYKSLAIYVDDKIEFKNQVISALRQLT